MPSRAHPILHVPCSTYVPLCCPAASPSCLQLSLTSSCAYVRRAQNASESASLPAIGLRAYHTGPPSSPFRVVVMQRDRVPSGRRHLWHGHAVRTSWIPRARRAGAPATVPSGTSAFARWRGSTGSVLWHTLCWRCSGGRAWVRRVPGRAMRADQALVRPCASCSAWGDSRIPLS